VRLWRKRTDNERWIKRFILADQARTVLVTISFRRFVRVVHAKEVGKRVVRWLKGVMKSWVRVLERGKGGVHVHFVVRLSGQLGIETGIKSIEVMIDGRKRAQEIGRYEVKPVDDAGKLSRFLVKTLEPRNWRGRVPGRPITYSAGVERPKWWQEDKV
jgi:hypothetical protein